MKTFLAVYMGSTSSTMKEKWNALEPKIREEKEKAGINAWMKWGEKHQESIISHGAPLGKTKLINFKGISDIKNLLTGYAVVKAESHQAAAEMFIEHPHFTMFPGDSVEIMECLPMPEI